MTRASYVLNFAHIVSFCVVIVASVLTAQLLDLLVIATARKFSNYFFRDITTNVLSIVGWVFLLFLFDFAEKLEAREVNLVL